MRGFHDLGIGLHMIKGNIAVIPIARFILTIMNHKAHFVQPLVRRRSVTAKLVLDQIAAQMEKTPPAEMTGITGMTSVRKSTSHEWAPYLKWATANVRMEDSMPRATCQGVSHVLCIL